MLQEVQDELRSELQRLMTLLKMKTGLYNIETRLCTNGKAYIMEVSPRGGGNRLCEMLHYATGVDLITAETRYIVGDSVPEIVQKPYQGHWAEVILHADQSGLFERLDIAEDLPAEIVEEDLWVKKNDRVGPFNGANDAIGTLVLKFKDRKEMENYLHSIHTWLKIIVQWKI